MKLPASHLKTDILIFWIILTSALCAGLLINQFRAKPLPLSYQPKEERIMEEVRQISEREQVESAETLSETAPGISGEITLEEVPEFVTLEEFQEYREQGEALIVDGRPEIFHRLGHIPGALSLPRDEFEAGYEKISDQPKDRHVIIYCSGSSCEDSELVLKGLERLGHTRLTIFKGGWAEWTAAGLPVEGDL